MSELARNVSDYWSATDVPPAAMSFPDCRDVRSRRPYRTRPNRALFSPKTRARRETYVRSSALGGRWLDLYIDTLASRQRGIGRVDVIAGSFATDYLEALRSRILCCKVPPPAGGSSMRFLSAKLGMDLRWSTAVAMPGQLAPPDERPAN
jgi:hypothetical protein